MALENSSTRLARGISVEEIANLISAKIIGDKSQLIKTFCALNHPEKDALTFAKTSSSSDLKKAISSGLLAAVILPNEIESRGGKLPVQLIVKDPLQAVSFLTDKFLAISHPPPGISKHADIPASAVIGEDVHIGAFCSIGENVVVKDGAVLYPQVVVYAGAEIGSKAVIHSGAVIREKCKIGDKCVVQNGAVIGADGFGYFLNEEKKLRPVPQVGNVELAQEVEIGANTCIDRATLGTTSVGNMTKIDNLVQVGHNTKIGQGSIICGNVGIAGSCEIGAGVTLGGGVGVADHVSIAPGVRIGGNSGVTGDITEKGDYVGYPPVKAQDWRRQAVSLTMLPSFMAKAKILLKTKKK